MSSEDKTPITYEGITQLEKCLQELSAAWATLPLIPDQYNEYNATLLEIANANAEMTKEAREEMGLSPEMIAVAKHVMDTGVRKSVVFTFDARPILMVSAPSAAPAKKESKLSALKKGKK